MEKAAGNTQRSWLVLTGLSVAAVAQVKACGPGDTPVDTGDGAQASELVADVLAGAGPNVVLPALEDLGASINLLGEAVDSWGASLAEDDGSNLDSYVAAQDAWLDVMTDWQRLEVMQMGTFASSLSSPDVGKDLRDEGYSWPATNPCRVDQKTADGSYNDEGFFTENLVNAYGLDALEHLLFASTESPCAPQVNPIANGAWSALGEAGILESRAAYASVLVDGLEDLRLQLVEEWSSDGGGFAPADLTAVYHALFYLETKAKDRKLALPLGKKDCGDANCASDLEGLVSGKTLEMIHANVEGFEALFQGGEGIGFDDLLEDLGHGDLNPLILEASAKVKSTIQAFEGDLYDDIVNEGGQGLELLNIFSELTGYVKHDLSTVLNLDVPTEAAGDND
jgi:hypothetical protein